MMLPLIVWWLNELKNILSISVSEWSVMRVGCNKCGKIGLKSINNGNLLNKLGGVQFGPKSYEWLQNCTTA